MILFDRTYTSLLVNSDTIKSTTHQSCTIS
jgi:hypothetical protein